MRTRLTLLGVTVTAGALAFVGVAGASTPTKQKPPVKLAGDVNNKGVGKVSKGALELEADDFYFEKTFVKGKAGSTVEVTVNNEGATAHTFTIDPQDVDETLQPGDSVDVTVKIPSNGKAAVFYCRFHVDQGMQGALFSKAAATGKRTSGSGSSGGSGSGGYDY